MRALSADGLTQREIARRLGINRRTVARLLASEEPPRYRRAAAGSRLDRFEPVLRRLLAEWPQVKAPRATEVLRECGYAGSVDLVRRRLRELRPRSVRTFVDEIRAVQRHGGPALVRETIAALSENERRVLRGALEELELV